MAASDASSFAHLQQQLGHAFRQPQLLQQALTHRSFSSDHYERLEFLGDSVLNLCISHWLFDVLAHSPEGDLSRIRANLVRQESLVQQAQQFDISALLRLGEGELRTGGRQRPSIVADALEAIIGAVYLDGGYDAAKVLVLRVFANVDLTAAAPAMAKDPKTALQEWLQKHKLPVPTYRVDQIVGAAHQQHFVVVCEVPHFSHHVQGEGASRRMAEQMAASGMLQFLKSKVSA